MLPFLRTIPSIRGYSYALKPRAATALCTTILRSSAVSCEAQALAMTLHELATNATKYGALSSEEGKVEISWDWDPGTAIFHFQWIESGVPLVSPPTRTGFGTTMLKQVLSNEFNAKIETHFQSTGINIKINGVI